MKQPGSSFEHKIKVEAQNLYSPFSSRLLPPNPFQICAENGVVTRFYALGSLKGFYVVINDIPFIVINSSLDDFTARVVCAHELGHHVLHRSFATMHLLNEYELYRTETRAEREANLFAAHLLIPDYLLQHTLQECGTDMSHVAGSLFVPLDLLELKLSVTNLTDALPEDVALQ